MKKLKFAKSLSGIFIAVLFLIFAPLANATLSHVTTTLDSTHTSFTVEVDYYSPDSAVKKITLLYDTDSNISGATHIDSVTASITDPDTLSGTGIQKNGASLWYWTIVEDSVTVDTSSSVKRVTLHDLTQFIED